METIKDEINIMMEELHLKDSKLKEMENKLKETRTLCFILFGLVGLCYVLVFIGIFLR